MGRREGDGGRGGERRERDGGAEGGGTGRYKVFLLLIMSSFVCLYSKASIRGFKV